MTKEKFQAFVKVQMSGKTNMFDINAVIRLSKFVLSSEDCKDIMQNYETYEKQFNIE